MFSVNRLVGRTESRARDHGPEITPLVLPRLPPLPRSAPYALVPVGTRPARPAGTGTARQIQSRVSREDSVDRVRRASHQSSREYTRGSTVTSTPGSPDRSTCLEGRGRHRSRAARGACGVWASSDDESARDDPGPTAARVESSGSGSTATLESRSCIMRDVHANPPRDISFSDACG